jgi:hypothetical protein
VVVTFELERFEWAAPDRLQLAGTFDGLSGTETDAPTLVVQGAERRHRLAVADGQWTPPEDGRKWIATFAWGEAPEAFDAAELQLGPDLAVELPEPHPGQRPFGGRQLKARQARAEDGAAEHNGAGGAVERLHLQSALVAAQEEAHERQVAAEVAEEELNRARQDLEAERRRHAADAERFRDSLASVRASAEEVVAAEQAVAEDLRTQLNAHDAELTELRGELEAAVAARAEAEADAEALREGLAAMKESESRNEELTAELELARVQAQEARTRREGAHGALGEARDEVARLLERLSAVRDSLGDGA